MKLFQRKRRIINSLFYFLILSTIFLSGKATDEEDELLDEVIPHQVFKRKFTGSSPKRQSIMTPDLGQGEQFMQMPQGGIDQFAGGQVEDLTGKQEQLPGGMVQGQGLAPETMGEQQGFTEQGIPQGISQGQDMQALGQQQPAEILPSGTFQQAGAQQITNEGVVTGLPENTKGFNENAAIETTLSDNSYRVTTDAKEKANSLVKDVKNFGLWEYSADNTAASTDQTAKLLQSKIEEDDALLKGQDSASLNPSQVANAQGTKIDELLGLFNKGPSENSGMKGLESVQSSVKGLEALDAATKGFTGLGGVEKSMNFLGQGKSVDGANSVSSLANDVTSLESAMGNQGLPLGGNGGHEGVSVVNIPNTYSLEDEHGNSLDSKMAGLSGNHKVEKTKAMQLLRALLKHKLEAQAFKMLLKSKALKAARKPSPSPTKGLKEQLTMFLEHTDQASAEEKGREAEDTEKVGRVSKLDLKLLKFIKHMLRKGVQQKKGVGEKQMKLFVTALKALGKNKNEASDEKEAEGVKEAKDEKEAKEEKDEKSEKEKNKDTKKEKEDEKDFEVKQSGKAEKDSKTEVKDESKKEAKQDSKLDLNSKKLKAIQALLKHVKPTSRSGHGFFMDPEQPLSNSEGMTSNSLMKYLEHETALLDQFQEGSQISDPALQLKQLAHLMMKVANKAQTKDAYVDARRTTVSPTGASDEEGGKLDDGSNKDEGSTKGEGRTKDKEGSDKSKSEDKEAKEEDKTQEKGEKVLGLKEKEEKDNDENNKVESKETKEESKDKKEDEGKMKVANAKEKQDETKDEEKEKEKEEKEKFAGNKDEGKDEKGAELESKGENKKAEKSNQENKEKETKSDESKDEKNQSKNDAEKTKELKKQPELDGARENGKPVEKVSGKEDKEEKETSKYKNDAEKTKELKKQPELDGARENGKPVEKVSGKEDKEEKETLKYKDGEEESDKKVGKEIESKGEDKVKNLKGLPEMSKLRNNKKIVNKIDNGAEKDAPAFNENKGDKDSSREKEGTTAGGHSVGFKDDDQSIEKSGTHKESKANVKDEGEAEVGQKSSEQKDGSSKTTKESESEAHHQDGKEATEQFDLYVTSKKNRTLQDDKSGKMSRYSEHQDLKPQLPFLNPGNAHLDALENDASLKQYLIQKGSKPGSLQNSASKTESESFDYKGDNRLLQLKDVTASSKDRIARKGEKVTNNGQGNEINTVKTRPNAVPPAGPGNPISSYDASSKDKHSIKPMSRLQLQKYKELMAYKKLVSQKNHLRASKGLMENGALRHIAPLLADRLVDAPSVRLAALARLISMAKEHHRMVDVTASKKTLPSSEHHLGNHDMLTSNAVTSSGPRFSLIKSSPRETSSAVTSSEKTLPEMTSSVTGAANTSSEMTSSEMTSSDMTSSRMKPTDVTSAEVRSRFHKMLHHLRPSSVLVPSRTHEGEISNLKSLLHETEAAPAAEASRLLSKAVVGENENGVDPSDVTRSRLEKPDKTSITKAVLGDPSSSKSTAAKEARPDGYQVSRTAPNLKENSEDKESRPLDKAHEVIVSSFFKRPAHPTANIRHALEELGSLSSAKDKKVVITESPEMGNVARSDVDNKAVVPVHEQEAAKALIHKADIRSIVRTLKTDNDAANFLLRKRSHIPRVKRRYRHKNVK